MKLNLFLSVLLVALVAANLMTAEGDNRESLAASCARSAAMVRSRVTE